MKIAIVQGAFFPVPPVLGGAVEKVWFALGREFARRGHEVVHISRKYGDLPDTETIDQVRHLRVPGFAAPRHLVALKALDLIYSLRVLRALPRADIVVTNTFWLPILIRSERYGKLYVHVQRFPKGQMRFYRHAARVQTVSSHIERAILDEAPCLAGKTRVIANPTLSAVEPSESPAGQPRQRQILYVGRVHPEKGIDLLIEAIGRIPGEAFADWKLVVVGPADVSAGGGGAAYLARLQELSRSFSARVEFVGPVFESERLNDYYRRSALFVYPSLAGRGEASPLAPLEAMAQGCPALVSDLECFRDYLTDGATGFVFDHRSADPTGALASTLARLILDPDRLSEIGQSGRRRSADFSIARIADQYVADFESLVPTPSAVSLLAEPCPPK